MTKTRYIPSGMVKFQPSIGSYPDSLCEVWVDLSKNTAIFYKGKSNKHLFYNRFRTTDDMKEKIVKTISNLMAWEDKKEQRKEARKAPHTLKVGDILYTSWGYDQTNVDFYQITKVISNRTVELTPIASKIHHSETTANYVLPIKDSFLKNGKVLTKRVGEGNLINIASYATAYPFDGNAKYETAFGFGH